MQRFGCNDYANDELSQMRSHSGTGGIHQAEIHKKTVQLREFAGSDLEHVQANFTDKSKKRFRVGIQKMFLHEAHCHVKASSCGCLG